MPSPLAGRLFDAVGNRLSPSHATKNGRRYRYYISTALVRGTRDDISGWRLPAQQLEAAIAQGADLCLADRGGLIAAIERTGIPVPAITATLAAAADGQRRLRSEIERAEALSALVERVAVLPGTLKLTLGLSTLIPATVMKAGSEPPTITREVPLLLKRRGVETRLVIESSPASRGKVDPILLKEVARAFRCFDALLTGKVSSFGELGAREGIDERYVRRILPLAFLAPDIVQAIVEGTQPPDLTAKKLVRQTELPLDWRQQGQVLGFRERGS